jgi:hypothetical protein
MALVRCRARATIISPTHYYEAGEEFVTTPDAARAHGTAVDILGPADAPAPPERAMEKPTADRMVRQPPQARRPIRGAKSGRFMAAPAGA